MSTTPKKTAFQKFLKKLKMHHNFAILHLDMPESSLYIDRLEFIFNRSGEITDRTIKEIGNLSSLQQLYIDLNG